MAIEPWEDKTAGPKEVFVPSQWVHCERCGALNLLDQFEPSLVCVQCGGKGMPGLLVDDETFNVITNDGRYQTTETWAEEVLKNRLKLRT